MLDLLCARRGGTIGDRARPAGRRPL